MVKPTLENALRRVEGDAGRLTNQFRADGWFLVPRGALSWSQQAATIARAHAREQAERGFRGHVSPEGAGLRERLRVGGMSNFLFAAENIATGCRTAEEAMTLLMANDGHKRNILSRLFNHMGCGATYCADGTFILVQIFIRPKPRWLGG